MIECYERPESTRTSILAIYEWTRCYDDHFESPLDRGQTQDLTGVLDSFVGPLPVNSRSVPRNFSFCIG